MRNIKQMLIVAIGVGLIACSPKYYSPNTQNVPLISEKGQTNLTLSGNGNQVEFQGAVGITDNFALQGNGGLFIPADLDNGNGGSGKFIELGAGYFNPVTENWVFETYGLVGIGGFENHFGATDLSANILRIGIQPNFGFKSTYFSAAVSSRIVNLSYSNIEGDLLFDAINQTQYLKDNASNLLIEPALTIRAGLKKVKLQIQYGYSLNLTNSDFKQDKPFLTAGLNFSF